MTAGTTGKVTYGVIGTVVPISDETKTSDSPTGSAGWGSMGYLAETDDAVLVLKTKANWGLSLKPKLTDEILEEVPRSRVRRAAFDHGYLSKLNVDFDDGHGWRLEIPRIYRKDAIAAVEALGGEIID